VLLVRHTYGKLNWEIPGGAALPGEAPDVAALRELEEETNVHATAPALSGAYFERSHPFGPMVHFVFRFAHRPTGNPIAQPPEISDVGWFSIDELPRPISDFTERRIRDALQDGVAYAAIEPRTWRE
jgi:8-oxo-dGTP pyrophosphatase MutT (NUDIX family)